MEREYDKVIRIIGSKPIQLSEFPIFHLNLYEDYIVKNSTKLGKLLTKILKNCVEYFGKILFA